MLLLPLSELLQSVGARQYEKSGSSNENVKRIDLIPQEVTGKNKQKYFKARSFLLACRFPSDNPGCVCLFIVGD